MVLTNLQKMEILIKYNEKKSMKDISIEMKINIKTVSKWINRFAAEKTTNRKRGTGLYKRIDLNL